MNKILIILGPTGVGKTELGVSLAKKFNGEIINADSRQVYREFDIGVCKPSEAFFELVPHYLFNLYSLNQQWDAASFQTEANEIIQSLLQKKKLPIIVGGTGLYIKALLYGLFEGPPAQPQIRNKLEKQIKEEGIMVLYEELKKADPLSANKIHPHDEIRIIRALEVYELTRKTITEHHKEHGFMEEKFHSLKIGLTMDRAILYEKINQRVDEMIQLGLEEEVRELIKQWGEIPLLLRAIGYKEWIPYFKGLRSKEEVTQAIKQNTRNFAKRQWAWFKNEKNIFWVEPGEVEKIEEKVKEFLCPPASSGIPVF